MSPRVPVLASCSPEAQLVQLKLMASRGLLENVFQSRALHTYAPKLKAWKGSACHSPLNLTLISLGGSQKQGCKHMGRRHRVSDCSYLRILSGAWLPMLRGAK